MTHFLENIIVEINRVAVKVFLFFLSQPVQQISEITTREHNANFENWRNIFSCSNIL